MDIIEVVTFRTYSESTPYTAPAHIAALTADMDILTVTDDTVLVGVERLDVWRQLQHPNIQKAINRAMSAVAERDIGLEVEEL